MSSVDNIPFNPSNFTIDVTLKNIIEKKQDTAKKTMNLFSEKKPEEDERYMIFGDNLRQELNKGKR